MKQSRLASCVLVGLSSVSLVSCEFSPALFEHMAGSLADPSLYTGVISSPSTPSQTTGSPTVASTKSSYSPSTKERKCGACNGSGQVKDTSALHFGSTGPRPTSYKKCPSCQGKGYHVKIKW